MAISQTTAAHVLYHFGEGGFPAGSFTEKLFRAIGAADPLNRAKLSIAFPEEVEAMVLAMEDPAGLDKMRTILAS